MYRLYTTLHHLIKDQYEQNNKKDLGQGDQSEEMVGYQWIQIPVCHFGDSQHQGPVGRGSGKEDQGCTDQPMSCQARGFQPQGRAMKEMILEGDRGRRIP
jgi:hypothetical protein